MVLAPFILAALPTTVTEVKIVDVQTRSFQAGKLGRRIQTVLTVEANGNCFVISAPSVHTRMANAQLPSYRVGDTLNLRKAWF